MAIQVRRGNESDFDASKMLPGEWAVSLDTRYVRMCFAPGIVLRMSTYDAFEADMAQIQAILAECRNIQSAVQRIQTEVNAKASLTVEYANDAKESADRAYSEAERAKTYADNAEAVTGVQIATKDRAGLIKGGNNHIAEDGTLMLITTTTSTTQPNSYAGREMVLEIGGVTEQDSTAGNQLCESFTTSSAIDIYNNALIIKADFKPNTQYTFSFKGAVGNRYYINENVFVDDITFTIVDGINTFTATTKDDFSGQVSSSGCLVLKNHRNQPNQNKFEEVMVNLGNTALPYEQYTGGIASPNPNYPQEIKKSVVSGVKTQHKNFIEPSKTSLVSMTYSNGVYTSSPLGSYGACYIHLNRNSNFKKGTTMYMSAKVRIKSGSGALNWFLLRDNKKAITANGTDRVNYAIGNEFIIASCKMTFQEDLSCDTILIQVNSTADNLVIEVKDIMVSIDTDFENYEPYQGTEITFSQPIELYGIGDVQDVIDVERGKVVRKFAEYDLSTLTQYFTSNKNGWYALLSELKPLAKCLFEKYKYSETAWYSDNYAGVDKDKTFWCKNNDSANKASGYMIAELATPTEETLPIVDQIGLNSLLTYDGITHVEFICDELEPTFKGKYGTSEVGGYTLESLLTARNNELRLTAVENAVVNNI